MSSKEPKPLKKSGKSSYKQMYSRQNKKKADIYEYQKALKRLRN